MQKFAKLFVLALCLTLVGSVWAGKTAKGPLGAYLKHGQVDANAMSAASSFTLPEVGSRRPGSLDEVIISENFDDLTPGDLPAGWTFVDVDDETCSDPNWPFDESEWTVLGAPFTPHSGTNTVANVYNDGAVPNNDWLILPQQNLTGTITLTFWSASQQAEYPETFAVKVSTTGTEPANFTNTLQTFANISTTWTEHVIDLSAYADAPFYVAFHHTSVDKWILKIDDVVLEGTLGAAGTISGTVTEEGTATPVAGATVSVVGGSTTTSDASGNYTLSASAGTHVVEATAVGYEDASVEGVVVVVDQTTDVDIAMVPFGTISGTVTASGTGAPIANATVEIADGPTTTTNAGGQYALAVAAGTYTVEASATGYTSTTVAGVVVVAGQTTTTDIEMEVSNTETSNYPSAATPVAIPDADPAGAAKTLTITDDFLIDDLDITVNITHTYVSDLDLYLVSPWGDSVQLAEDPTTFPAGANMTNCRFDDEAEEAFDYETLTAPFTGSWRPFATLEAFDGFTTAGAWRLRAIDNEAADTGTIGIFTIHVTHEASPVDNGGAGLPTEFAMSPAFPNPFNPSTQITFDVPVTTNAEMKVFNSLGQEVATLFNGQAVAGTHTLYFVADNLPSGLYFAQLTAGSFVSTQKLVLIK